MVEFIVFVHYGDTIEEVSAWAMSENNAVANASKNVRPGGVIRSVIAARYRSYAV